MFYVFLFQDRKVFHAFMWFMRFSCMSYLALGFQVLTFEHTFGYYSSIYFAGHVLVGLLWAVGKMLRDVPDKEINKEVKVQ